MDTMNTTSAGNRIEIPGFGSVAPGSQDDFNLGAVLGMAVGDALGTTYEFKRIDQAPYPTLATEPATDVVGGGPFGLVAGQITDDTQMAICIARSLLASPPDRRGFDRLNALDIATRYVAWYQHAFDVGSQTSSALGVIQSGTDVMAAGRTVWHNSGRRAAGNGSLMRTAPLGVALAGCPVEQIIEGALTDSLLTHADPRCVLAAASFDVAIAHAINATGSRDPAVLGAAMTAAARAALPLCAARLRELWRDNTDDLAAITNAESDLARDLDAALADDPGVYGSELDVQRTSGFVRVAFRLAFWHVVHTGWRDAVVDVASRGGDADTNAAIVGALVGARDGISAIPRPWLDRVLAVTQPGPADWAAAHHPRDLVALALSLQGGRS